MQFGLTDEDGGAGVGCGTLVVVVDFTIGCALPVECVGAFVAAVSGTNAVAVGSADVDDVAMLDGIVVVDGAGAVDLVAYRIAETTSTKPITEMPTPPMAATAIMIRGIRFLSVRVSALLCLSVTGCAVVGVRSSTWGAASDGSVRFGTSSGTVSRGAVVIATLKRSRYAARTRSCMRRASGQRASLSC